MKTHSTNYYNTFVEIAEDSRNTEGQIPPQKGDKKTLANWQFEMVYDNPYRYTSDDVFFTVFAERKDIAADERETERQVFFSKGQPCFRASPLTKQYGWGVHSDENGKVALYPAGSKEYQSFLDDPSIKKVKAMKSRK